MRLLTVVLAGCLVACDDAPPAGQTTLQAPHSPVFFGSGAAERLAFIDSGHSMIRFLDLAAGTYQYGNHPFFPRGVLLDDEPVALAAVAKALWALDAAGGVYTVSAALEGALRQPTPVGSGEPVALVEAGETVGRVDRDCGVALVDADQRIETSDSTCNLGAGRFVTGELLGAPQLWTVGADGLSDPVALPWHVSAISPDSAAGVWLLSASGLALLHLDAAGEIDRLFGLEREASSLALSEDVDGELLALAGLDGAIAYYRVDGSPLGDRQVRTPLRLAALAGAVDGLQVKLASDSSLVVGDYMLRATPLHGSGTATAAAGDDGVALADRVLEGEAAVGDWVRVVSGEQSCSGRIATLTASEMTFVPTEGSCPAGDVSFTTYAPVWAVYDGQTSFDPVALEEPAGVVAPGASLTLGGVDFSVAEVPEIGAGVGHLRVGAGLRTTLDSDGWLSGITGALSQTFYGEATVPWLWVTVPTQAALYQLPVAAQQTFDMVIFR
jgi:hypothetical protein